MSNVSNASPNAHEWRAWSQRREAMKQGIPVEAPPVDVEPEAKPAPLARKRDDRAMWDALRATVRSRAAWYRDGQLEPPTRTEAERDQIVLDWQARLFAALSGKPCPIAQAPAKPEQPTQGAVPTDGYATISDAARMVNVSRQTLHVAIRQGILRMVQPAPGIQRVKLSDLHHWNANRATYALDAQERRKETLRKRHRATA